MVIAALVLGGTYPLAVARPCSLILKRHSSKQLWYFGELIKVEYLDSPRSVPHILAKNRMMSVPRRFLATLAVAAVWKGTAGPTIVLHPREGSSDCVEFWSAIGKDVLVFAHSDVTPKRPAVWRIPEWTDKIAVGEMMTSPRCLHSHVGVQKR